MSKRRYSPFHAFIQKLAASRPGTWYFSHTQHYVDHAFLKLTRGQTSLTSLLSGLPVVILTTVGAKSGVPRTLPLLCIRDGGDPDTFAIVASNWGQHHNPAWYYNLKARSQASCSLGGHSKEYVAHEATGAEYEKFWQTAMDTYIGFPLYEQWAGARHIPIMVMSPAQKQAG